MARTKKLPAELRAVTFAADIPEPYSILESREKELYYLVAERMRATMPLLPLDVFVLQQMAIALALAEKMHMELHTKGAIQVYAKNKARAVAPEMAVYEKAVIMIQKLSAMFGMSPKDRVALLGFIAPQPERPDPTDGL